MGGVGAAILEAHLFCCFAILEAHLDAVVGERLEGVESSCGAWSNIVFNLLNVVITSSGLYWG